MTWNIITLTDENLEAVSEETGRSVDELTRMYTEAHNRGDAAMVIIEEIKMSDPTIARLKAALLFNEEPTITEVLKKHAVSMMADGSWIPTVAIDALNELEERWPGATLEQARPAIVSAIIKKLSHTPMPWVVQTTDPESPKDETPVVFVSLDEA